MAPNPAFERLATPAGLCERCLHVRLLASQRSVFLRCARADGDERYPRYPALPVTRCLGFENLTPDPSP